MLRANYEVLNVRDFAEVSHWIDTIELEIFSPKTTAVNWKKVQHVAKFDEAKYPGSGNCSN